jgi:hypothetical protein
MMLLVVVVFPFVVEGTPPFCVTGPILDSGLEDIVPPGLGRIRLVVVEASILLVGRFF